MKNKLLFLSHNDIPFPEARISIHNPLMEEIGLIGESSFNSGCMFLNFSKNFFIDVDKTSLDDKSDFDIFMSIMNDSKRYDIRDNVLSVLTLLFPDYQISFLKDKIMLEKNEEKFYIDNENYDAFKSIIKEMFRLEEVAASEYNPVDAKAAKIAAKLQKAKAKKNKGKKTEEKEVSIFSRFISILAVGEHRDMNSFMNYTVAQLKEEFERYQMKNTFDSYQSAILAGATNLEEVDNWMDELHS